MSNHFPTLAATDRRAFNQLRRDMQRESRAMPNFLKEVHRGPEPEHHAREPYAAWRNREFLVQLFKERGTRRLSINRSDIENDGHWKAGISWEQLMELKRQAGFGNCWAVEVYPPDHHTVNVAAIRHLWLVDQPPYAWIKEESQ